MTPEVDELLSVIVKLGYALCDIQDAVKELRCAVKDYETLKRG